MSKQMEKSALGQKSSGVVLKEITKIFQQPDTGKDFVAVDHINLNIQDGEMVTLLGPSGCGKTTTLRMISGFEYPTSGSVFIGERDVAKIPPNKRGISMVFQSYALFPHLNIWENVAYGLKVAKVSQDEVVRRTNAVMELMQLTGMERRFPNQLSGGQQQRVALARIMASDPAVIMLDEPLSALDSFLHWQLELKLSRILREYSGTTIYVSHNRDEVYRLCDRVCVINEGHSEPVKTVSEFFDAPPTLAAAILSGCKNFSRIEIIDSRRLRASDWNMTFTSAHLIPDEARYVGVRAHYLIPVAERERDENTMRAEIIEVRDDVFSAIITVRPNETKSESNFAVIRIELSKELAKNYRAGETIYLKVAPSDVMPLLP